MCCDTTVCGAQSENCRFRFVASCAALYGVDSMSHDGDPGRNGVKRRCR
jgi:hypothetical protein